mgnify:CR=1 FL=1
MEKTDFIWMDDELVPWEEANIHVLSHGLHYGSGVFEGIRFYKTEKGPAIFKLKEHIDRLYSSAESLNMNIPYTKEDFAKAVIKTVSVNNLKEGYIRPIIFYGYGKMGLNPSGAKLKSVIAVWPWPAYIGDEASVIISDYVRIHPQSLNADKKVCGHYVNSILASFEARKKGYDEALLLDYLGRVAEGPGENLFMVKNNKVYTVPAEKQILPGITRNTIIDIAKKSGYEVEEKHLTKEELFEADELFFTGTAAEVTSITKLNDKEFDLGKITKELKKKYLDVVKGRNTDFQEHLTVC